MPIDGLIEHKRFSKPSKAGLGHGCEHCASTPAMMPIGNCNVKPDLSIERNNVVTRRRKNY